MRELSKEEEAVCDNEAETLMDHLDEILSGDASRSSDWDHRIRSAVLQRLRALKARSPVERRRVIQITGDTHDLTALCDDGTIWSMGANHWVRWAPIPGAAEGRGQ